MSWEYTLAKAMRDKPAKASTEGAMIGVTVSVDPLKVQVQNGQFLLDSDDCYVCSHLMERKSKIKIEATAGTMNGGAWQEFSISDGETELAEVWKPGDKVLVVPDATGQKFFIVDKLMEG